MRKLYYVSTERVGECEGIFDKDGTLLDIWSNNDASWRNEYFAPFMRKLGFDVQYNSALEPDLIAAAKELWGVTEDDE